MTMQQSLENLARLAEQAADLGYVKTQEQLSRLHDQLESLNEAPSQIMIDLLNKVESHIDRSINEEDDVESADEALAQDCQESAQALFHSYNLTQALDKELHSLAQMNERAQTNQRYYDKKKNEAVQRFRIAVNAMRAKAAMNAAEIAEFNSMLQDLLEQDFAVKNLPKAAMPQQTADDTSKAKPGLKPFIDVLSNVASAANSGDQDEMKNAAGSFVGLLLSMIVECIGTVCKTLAPSSAPFIDQLAQFAKNAFSKWFSSSTGIAMNMPEFPESDKKDTSMPKSAATSKAKSAMPSTTFDAPNLSTLFPSADKTGGGMLHAAQRFLQRSMHQQPTTSSASHKPTASKPVAQKPIVPTKPMTSIPTNFVRPRNGNTIPKPL